MAINYPSSMPYDTLTYIDQSQYIETTEVEEVNTIPDGPIAFIPFVSPRGYGEDNKLKYMPADVLTKYGNPNLKKYGLSLYLAKRFTAGGGTVLGMRMVPDNATYASKGVCAILTKKSIKEYAVSYDRRGEVVYSPYWYVPNTGSSNKTTLDGITISSATAANIIYDGKSITPSAVEMNTALTKDYLDSLTQIKINEEEEPYYLIESSVPAYTQIVYDETVYNKIIESGEYKPNETEPGVSVYILDTDNKYVEFDKDDDEHKQIISDGKSSFYTKETIAGAMCLAKPVTVGTDKQFTDDSIKYTLAVTSDTVVVRYVLIDFAGDNAYTSKSISPFALMKDTINGIKILKEDTVINQGDEYICPMFIVSSKAKGGFANSFSFSIEPDATMNNEITFRNLDAFCYKFTSLDSGKTLDRKMTFSFNEDFVYDSESLAIEEVFDTYGKNIELIVEKSFDIFKKYITDNCTNTSNINNTGSFNKLDILFGTNANLSTYYVESAPLTSVVGIALTNGNLGDFETNAYEFPEANDGSDMFREQLIAAYSGETSDLVFDEVRFPFEYIFAPTTDLEVIKAIHELVDKDRHITRVNYFIPNYNSEKYTEARNWVSNNIRSIANTWKETVVPEWAQIRDPYTGKKTYMPSVYFDAYHMPEHWLTKKGVPYAGPANYKWTDFVIGSVIPHTTNPNEYIANHNVGINTMCEDGVGGAVPYEQITAQTSVSRLSEINNCVTLVHMARIALATASNQRWSDITDESEISNYKIKVEGAISASLSGCYKSMEVIAERESVNGAGRNRIHCKINVLFKDMLKGVSYEFYILAN